MSRIFLQVNSDLGPAHVLSVPGVGLALSCSPFCLQAVWTSVSQSKECGAEGPILAARYQQSQALPGVLLPSLHGPSQGFWSRSLPAPRNAISTVATGWQRVRTEHISFQQQPRVCPTQEADAGAGHLGELMSEKAAPATAHLLRPRGARPALLPAGLGQAFLPRGSSTPCSWQPQARLADLETDRRVNQVIRGL